MIWVRLEKIAVHFDPREKSSPDANAILVSSGDDIVLEGAILKSQSNTRHEVSANENAVWVIRAVTGDIPQIFTAQTVSLQVSRRLRTPISIAVPKQRPLVLVCSNLPWSIDLDPLASTHFSDTVTAGKGGNLQVVIDNTVMAIPDGQFYFIYES